jgi:hypothetical protein
MDWNIVLLAFGLFVAVPSLLFSAIIIYDLVTGRYKRLIRDDD